MFKAVFCKFSKSLFPFLICSVVIPIVAATCDIALSNLVATPTEAAPTPTRGRVKPFVNPPPTVENALLKPFNFCSVVAPLAWNTFKSLIADLNPLLNLLVSSSRKATAEPMFKAMLIPPICLCKNQKSLYSFSLFLFHYLMLSNAESLYF